MMLQRSTSCEGKARSRATKQGRVTGPGDPESAVCRDTRAHAGRNLHDRADWSEENTHSYCELAVEEIQAGNCFKGAMTRRGYCNMKKGMLLKTGLNLSIKQLKNRWPQCRVLYTFWNMLQTDTGLGRRSDGSVVASASWWERH
ncbi:hypothetical protein SEVIR_1G238380v4 [Setaria viridis]